jgi:hypothetical protein
MPRDESAPSHVLDWINLIDAHEHVFSLVAPAGPVATIRLKRSDNLFLGS